ncbi:MAG TPA: CBS domain-containing protein, partial [Acidobacteriota bacterium]|nr:CBS domain-containing protein [Acidobacteriota bacterium]
MNILTIWLAVLFALSFFAYLSFSLICEDVVAWALMPPEKEKEQEYSLAPLSVLFPDVEKLISVLSSSRLLFALPAILLAYYWSSHLGAWIAAAILAALIVLLYVIPQEFLSRTSLSPFKGTVQVFGYLFYPVYWIIAKLSPAKARSEVLEAEQRNAAEPHEEETEEFKGDIIKAISVIGETTIREVMTPRVDMVSVSATSTLAELHQLFKDHKFTRIPVYKERIDNVTGIVSMVDFIDCMPNYDLNAPVSDLM